MIDPLAEFVFEQFGEQGFEDCAALINLIRQQETDVKISNNDININDNRGNSISVGSSGVSINAGGRRGVVINGDQVIINGEKCYPKGLIEDLDQAWHDLALYHERNAIADETPELAKIVRQLKIVRRALDLS